MSWSSQQWIQSEFIRIQTPNRLAFRFSIPSSDNLIALCGMPHAPAPPNFSQRSKASETVLPQTNTPWCFWSPTLFLRSHPTKVAHSSGECIPMHPYTSWANQPWSRATLEVVTNDHKTLMMPRLQVSEFAGILEILCKSLQGRSCFLTFTHSFFPFLGYTCSSKRATPWNFLKLQPTREKPESLLEPWSKTITFLAASEGMHQFSHTYLLTSLEKAWIFLCFIFSRDSSP